MLGLLDPGARLRAYIWAGVALCLVAGLAASHVVAYRHGLKIARAEALEQQRDLAQRTADAYGAELAAARERADAAERAARAAADQAAADKTRADTAIRRLRDAPPVPAGCVPDALRVRINAAVSAANGTAEAGDAIRVPDRVPATAGTGLRFKGLGG